MGKERPPDLTGASGSGRRTQRPQIHARAEQIQTVFQTCAPGPEIIGAEPRESNHDLGSWLGEDEQGSVRGMPTPGRSE